MAEEFVENLEIEKFFGIGKVTAEKMHKLHIHKGYDLKQKSLKFLTAHFGKQGAYYYNIARAVDNREVNPDRIRKSIGTERTFSEDIYAIEKIYERTEQIAGSLIERCKKAGTYGKTITLKVKYSDFKQITRSKTVNFKIKDFNTVMNLTDELFNEVDFTYNPVRLIGLSVSQLDNKNREEAFQLSFEFK